MARKHSFSDSVKIAAYSRQQGLCACCGEGLTELDQRDNAHHVLPDQSCPAADSWAAEVDNCVVICEDCHYIVHEGGRYRKGAVAPPEYFEHSHGRDRAAHANWVARTTPRFWGKSA